MDKTVESYLKSVYSRAFGYYMESLLSRNLAKDGINIIHESTSRVSHIGLGNIEDFSNKFRKALESDQNFLNLFAWHFPDLFDIDTDQTGREITSFPLKDWDPQEFLSRIVGSNFLEIVRWEDGNPIFSEVKSSWGPVPTNKVTISVSQILKLYALRNAGIRSSVIYMVALQEPRWTEIPIEALSLQSFPDEFLAMLEETVPTVDSSGKLERYARYYYTRNITIPSRFRDSGKMQHFVSVPHSFYDIQSLIEVLKNFAPVYYLPSKQTMLKVHKMLSETDMHS